MKSGTLSFIIVSQCVLTVWSQWPQYFADNQYYYYQQNQQQNYWPQYQPQVVRYPPPQTYVPRQTPQAVVPPLQQQPAPQQPVQQPRVQQYVPEKKPTGGQGRVVSANTYEFDLPPPPSRFLPDEERTKILSLNKQGRPDHSGTVSPQQRIRLVTGATNSTKQNSQPPQVQIHHLQVPRLLQKTVVATPTEMTHFIASAVVTTTTPQPITQTSRLIVVTPTTTTQASTTERHFEVETTTRPVSHLSPHNNKVNPNKIFLQCCLEKKVAKPCEAKCSFDNINKKTLTSMFLGTDPCPQSYGLDLFACAAQENDHTTCCKAKNVQRTSAGAKCLAFCNLRPESHFQADASYLPCWAVLNDVKNCFREAIVKGEPM